MRIIVPVTDIDAAKAVYGALLGTAPHTDTPYYVGYRSGEDELALNPGAAQLGLTTTTPYWAVPDAAAALAALVAAGAEAVLEPTEVGGGTVLAHARDRDGNLVALIQGPTV